jgi:hypothetical protein
MRSGRSRLVVAAKALHRNAVDFLQGDEQRVTAATRRQRQASAQLRRDESATVVVEEDLAGNADDPGVDAFGMRQILPAHARAAAVGGDQHVALRRRAVFEVGADSAGRQFFVAHEGLVEMHDIVEAGQQHSAERDAADRAMLGDAVAAGMLWRVQFIERQQHLHPFGDEADTLGRLAAGTRERVKQRRRQTFVQSQAAGWIDVDPIALHPVGAGAVALIDGDADAGLFQALRQSEAANTAADDDDMERRRRRGDDGFDVRLYCHDALRSNKRPYPGRGARRSSVFAGRWANRIGPTGFRW